MAARKMITSADARRLRVMSGEANGKHIGRVRHCVFHPKEKRCLGMVVKRPDLALMFHRKDLFVALDGFDLVEGRAVVRDEAAASGSAACRRLGVNWDDCVVWDGMPLMTSDEKLLGLVGSVAFDLQTGKVDSVEVSNGVTAKYLLGTLEVPSDMILGFRRGVGMDLAVRDDARDFADGDDLVKGAIVVSDDVWLLTPEGGWAEAAGEFTAKAAQRAKGAAEEVSRKAKPRVRNAADAAGQAINDGAFAVGKRIAGIGGMFASFKEEYNKAVREEPSDCE